MTSAWGRLATSIALGAVASCTRADANTPATSEGAPRPPSLTVLIVDRSTSRAPQQLEADRQLINSIVGELNFGDRLVVTGVHHNGRLDGVRAWPTTMPVASNRTNPTPMELKDLTENRNAAARAVQALLDSVRANRTDLLATFADVRDFMLESKVDRTRLVVLSDMLHSTPALNMEHAGGIPDSAWIGAQKAAGAIPDLPSACVVVVGADRSTKKGQEVERFWQRYFAAAGSTLRSENYRLIATDAQALRC